MVRAFYQKMLTFLAVENRKVKKEIGKYIVSKSFWKFCKLGHDSFYFDEISKMLMLLIKILYGEKGIQMAMESLFLRFHKKVTI